MKLADGHPINLPVLLETRLLVQAGSGGGKSWALRRLLEQTAPHVQQLVIDPEGEFATLREKFDYVIAAAHDADAVASPQTAAMLARRLMESGVSAVLDIYDLKHHERVLFVRRFLDALVNLPRKLWHPVLVVLDEAHVFCPQVGSAESASAVIDIATRGRKRGLCAVLATQRLSKLHKDAAAEMQNKLIGLTGLDVDVKRAADELGMAPRDALQSLRALEPGQFYAFGPALTRAPELVKIGPVTTTHPKAGQRLLQAPPPASEKVRAELAKLADLQKDADQEARTIEELQALNAKLRREATIANKRAEQAGVPEKEVQARIAAAVAQHQREKGTNAAPESSIEKKAFDQISKIVCDTMYAREHAAKKIPPGSQAGDSRGPVRAGPLAGVSRTASARPAAAVASAAGNTGLSGPEQRILDAIAWMERIGVDEPEQPAVAFLAGYTFGAGGFNNPKGRLNQSGLVSYIPGGRIRLTDQGRALANAPSAPASTEELHARVLAKLPGPEQRILRPLLDAYPREIQKTDLAHAAGYTPGSGGFNNPCGRLRTLGLIDYPSPGHCVAKSLLFPEKAK